MNWREAIGVDELRRERPPRGAVVIVVIGLIACVVAVLASTGRGEGEAAHLEWVKETKIADSEAVEVPGGEGQKMQLIKGRLRATGTNVSGYSLYQVAETLRIDAEAPLKGSRLVCSMSTPHGVEIGHSSKGLRTLYPRSSEGIYTQEVPETLLVSFSSHSSELAVLEVGDYTGHWSTEKGVKLEWGEFEEGAEHLRYFIAGKPKHALELPFYAIWKSNGVVPKADISCKLEVGAGNATVSSSGGLQHLPPPIDEEKEAEEQEQRAEEESAQGTETSEAE